MKTSYQIITIAFVLLTITKCSAQSTGTLGVGDHAPELSPLQWLTGVPTTSWDSKRFYLIEFGATWCGPCAAAIPELSQLQSDFPDALTVISLFVKEKNEGSNPGKIPPYVNRVKTYLEKRGTVINYTTAVDTPDGALVNRWLNPAGLVGIPHIFIIDQKSVIQWIGSNPKAARNAITALIKKQESLSAQSAKFDRSKLLLIGGNGGAEDDFLFRSLLTTWDGKIYGQSIDHIFSFHHFKPDSVYERYRDKLQIIGTTVEDLYYMAYADTLSNSITTRHMNDFWPDTIKMPYTKTTYGKYWHNPIIEVSGVGILSLSSDLRSKFNYSLKVPKGMGSAKYLQQILQRDLKTYFGYNVEVQVRTMPYWSLKTTDKSLITQRLISKEQSGAYTLTEGEEPCVFKNAEVRDIITMLGITYGYSSFDFGKLPVSEQGAFIDETLIANKIDFNFNRGWTFEQCRTYLNTIGLNLTKAHRPMKVIVIKNPVD